MGPSQYRTEKVVTCFSLSLPLHLMAVFLVGEADSDILHVVVKIRGGGVDFGF